MTSVITMVNAENGAFTGGGGGGGGANLSISAGDGIIVEKIGLNVTIAADVDETTIGITEDNKIKSLLVVPTLETTDGISLTTSAQRIIINTLVDETTIGYTTDHKLMAIQATPTILAGDGITLSATAEGLMINTKIDESTITYNDDKQLMLKNEYPLVTVVHNDCTSRLRNMVIGGSNAIDLECFNDQYASHIMTTFSQNLLESSNSSTGATSFIYTNVGSVYLTHATTAAENSITLSDNDILMSILANDETIARARLSPVGFTVRQPYDSGEANILTTNSVDGETIVYNATTHKISSVGGGGGGGNHPYETLTVNNVISRLTNVNSNTDAYVESMCYSNQFTAVMRTLIDSDPANISAHCHILANDQTNSLTSHLLCSPTSITLQHSYSDEASDILTAYSVDGTTLTYDITTHKIGQCCNAIKSGILVL
jgi:hypothetical protein